MNITTVGVDLAKQVFAIHGVNEHGVVLVKRTLRRHQFLDFFRKLPGCLVGMEACGTAHYWARELAKLGHEIRLMPPSYVKPYVKRGKSDGLDAEACCEAVRRPTMRFVPVKTEEQQGVLTLHRARSALVQVKTKVANVIRSLCAEFGVVAPLGTKGLGELVQVIRDDDDERLPAVTRIALKPLADQLDGLHRRSMQLEQEIVRRARCDEQCRRLSTIPGVGPITASALVATVGDAGRFKSGRDLAAWLGLTRKAHSSGGRADKGGGISKQGDRHLRELFVQGAASIVRTSLNPNSHCASPWLRQLLERKSRKLAIVAQANKTARIAWAVLTRGQSYRANWSAAAI